MVSSIPTLGMAINICRHSAIISAALVPLVFACGDSHSREGPKLDGSWLHEIYVLGRPQHSLLTLRPNGTFREDAIPADSILKSPGKITLVAGTALQTTWGTWSRNGRKIAFRYKCSTELDWSRYLEIRRITALTKTDFVSVDLKFGIPIERTRVADAKYKPLGKTPCLTRRSS